MGVQEEGVYDKLNSIWLCKAILETIGFLAEKVVENQINEVIQEETSDNSAHPCYQ